MPGTPDLTPLIRATEDVGLYEREERLLVAQMCARLTYAAVETLYEGEDVCGFYTMGNEVGLGNLITCTGVDRPNAVLWDAVDGQQYRVTVRVEHIGAIPPERSAPDAD